MSYKEFQEENERCIVRNSVIFNFTKLQPYKWVIEVSIRTLPLDSEDGHESDWTKLTNVVTSIEAYFAYKNVLKGGLE